jgi:peptidoglycan/LPS O-acetylase OafA/YrhL
MDGGRPDARLPGIEGLRAFAAGGVLLFHVWVMGDPGGGPAHLGAAGRLFAPLQAGVTLFFVLSGYLLYRPFAAALARGGPLPAVRRYARRRVLRILPAYWVVLGLSALVGAAIVHESAGGLMQVGYLRDPATLVRDATLTQNLTTRTFETGLGPAWSLAIEAVFYAVLPALALGAAFVARRLPPRQAILVPVAVLAVTGVAGRLSAGLLVPGLERLTGGSLHGLLAWSFLGKADLFAFGMAVTVLQVRVEDGTLRLPRPLCRVGTGVLALAGLPCLFAAYWLLPRSLYEPLMAALFALLLLHVVMPARFAGGHAIVGLLERRPLVWVGTISYSVFLWSMPLGAWMLEHGLVQPGVAGFARSLVLGVGVCLLLASATYALVERPAMRAAARRRAAPLPSAAAPPQAA